MKFLFARNVFILAFILFSVVGCSRYDEGPCISFRSALDRIEGRYSVVYLSKNNVDITQNWKDSCNWHFSFDDNENTPRKEQMLDYGGKCYVDDSLTEIVGESVFGFDKKHRKLFLEMTGYSYTPAYLHFGFYTDTIGMDPFLTGDIRSFDILRLTPTELWLKKEYPNGDQYIIKLEEIAEL